MPWQWAGRTLGSILAVAAGVLMLLQVGVHAPGGGSLNCGSPWDVVAGRTGWPQWWGQDLADTSRPAGALVRTRQCPTAVNHRLVTSGGLLTAAVVGVAAGELVGRRTRTERAARGRGRGRSRLRTLGALLTAVGCLLTATGLAGVALLVANPDAPLFLYVSRPVVALVGSLLVIPAVFVAALGLTARAAADQIDRGPGADR